MEPQPSLSLFQVHNLILDELKSRKKIMTSQGARKVEKHKNKKFRFTTICQFSIKWVHGG